MTIRSPQVSLQLRKLQDNMQKIVALVFLVGFSLGAEVPAFPKGALLVFPSPENSTTTAAPVSKSKENLEGFDAYIMERLRQETGSEQGVYHVYLPDGRLQRVQYTAAPIAKQAAQATAEKGNEKQREGRINIVPEAVYFVQVGGDRLQDIKTPEILNSTQERNQTAVQDSDDQANATSQYKDATAPEPVQYLPITVITPDQLSQLRTAQPDGDSQQQTFSSNQQQAYSDSQQQAYTNSQQQAYTNSQQQASSNNQQPAQDETNGYTANLRVSQVAPIQPPIYNYSPLVRILRYASD